MCPRTGRKVKDGSHAEMEKLGIVVDALEIQEIEDSSGYISNLAAPHAAAVASQARIAKARADQEATERELAAASMKAQFDDPTRRAVDPRYGRDGDVVSFADGYPLLLTSTASLDELGRWLIEDGEQPVPMTRFRPNAVVTGAPPWAEDQWRRIRIGEVEFRVAKPCGRCVVTTTDQITGEVGSQPLKMLGRRRRRRFSKQLAFGQNMIPDGPGVIRVGDLVEVLKTA